MRLPKAGDRYVVTAPFACTVLTHWHAPFTGGDERTIPAGLEFLVDYEPPPGATAVGGIPQPADKWQALLVSEADRKAKKYGGYSLSVPFSFLETHCRLIDGA